MYEIRKTKEKERCKNETKQQRYYIDCACHNNSTNAIKVIPFIFFNFFILNYKHINWYAYNIHAFYQHIEFIVIHYSILMLVLVENFLSKRK